jgi:chromosomal replication initiator protein
LGVANEFYQIWLQDNFLPLIREVVNKVSRQPLQVRLTVSQGLKTPPELPQPTSTSHEKRSSGRTELNVTLNPRYTFDSFVVGPNNNFAHAAALAVAQSPAKAYNPLFMYGGVGLGKTHLMQAIGHASSNGAKSRKVSYITCEQFTNDFIQAIQNSTMTKFRKKYRQVDVLLIDDIQFLAGKSGCRTSFSTRSTPCSTPTSRSCCPATGRPPRSPIWRIGWFPALNGVWSRSLQPPALETRIAILKKKAALIDVKLSDQVMEFIAEKIRTNIRRDWRAPSSASPRTHLSRAKRFPVMPWRTCFATRFMKRPGGPSPSSPSRRRWPNTSIFGSPT